MIKWPEKKLGFGLMRLPKDENGNIIYEKVKLLVDTFMESGCTYFDTAYVYPGSEVAFKECVSSRYPRDSYTVTSKLAGWALKDDFLPEQMFNESLNRCGVEYFDFYLLHSLQESHMDSYDKYDCWNFVKKMKDEGKIKTLGFSFHGTPALLEKILKEHPEIDLVQLQINYLDWENVGIDSKINYETVIRYGKKISIMEPIKGGALVNLNEKYERRLKVLDVNASNASYALRFAGSLPGVAVVLSGMNDMTQLEENTKLFTDFKPITDKEKEVLFAIADEILHSDAIQCTACSYCTDGCPMTINIPEIFKAYNRDVMGGKTRAKEMYKAVIEKGSGKASECIQCGQCEGVCPQHIDIIEKLKMASTIFE